MTNLHTAAQQCVACEGKPSRENNPCAVCGKPAQQEPVGDITCWTVKGHLKNTDFDYYGNLPDGTHLLYTSPPAQRTWVGLTDEEVITMSRYDLEYAALIGEVERKLKEKNT